jgi:hypothetical protein
MTQKTHTPAPWLVAEDTGVIYVEGEENDFAICDTQAENTYCLSFSQAIANARLIAAAPELLNALNVTVSALALYMSQSGKAAVDIGNDVTVKEALAAIAKAQGE